MTLEKIIKVNLGSISKEVTRLTSLTNIQQFDIGSNVLKNSCLWLKAICLSSAKMRVLVYYHHKVDQFKGYCKVSFGGDVNKVIDFIPWIARW